MRWLGTNLRLRSSHHSSPNFPYRTRLFLAQASSESFSSPFVSTTSYLQRKKAFVFAARSRRRNARDSTEDDDTPIRAPRHNCPCNLDASFSLPLGNHHHSPIRRIRTLTLLCCSRPDFGSNKSRAAPFTLHGSPTQNLTTPFSVKTNQRRNHFTQRLLPLFLGWTELSGLEQSFALLNKGSG